MVIQFAPSQPVQEGIACDDIAGDLIVTGSSDHMIKLFDLHTGEEVRTLRGHSHLVRTLQSNDTKLIAEATISQYEFGI